MHHQRKSVHVYRKRKFERMLERLNNVQYMILPGDKPGNVVHATNVLLTRSEISFFKLLIKHGIETRSPVNERERDISDTVAIVLAKAKERRASGLPPARRALQRRKDYDEL